MKSNLLIGTASKRFERITGKVLLFKAALILVFSTAAGLMSHAQTSAPCFAQKSETSPLPDPISITFFPNNGTRER